MSAFDNADNLIDELVQAIKESILHPKSVRLLKIMGRKRSNLERYIFRIERKAGIRSKEGRYDT